MPAFTADLITGNILNHALCEKIFKEECRWKDSDNGWSVFNHGAEAQNFYFVQDLDPRLTVIIPRELITQAKKAFDPQDSGSHRFQKLNTTEMPYDVRNRVYNVDVDRDQGERLATFINYMRNCGFMAATNPRYKDAKHKKYEDFAKFNEHLHTQAKRMQIEAEGKGLKGVEAIYTKAEEY